MEVYILYSNWMSNGDNVVNEVIGIYDCFQKAQHGLAVCINTDLQNHLYEHFSLDEGMSMNDYNVQKLAAMHYDDPDFAFNVWSAKFWNGEEKDDSESFQLYSIEKHSVL